MKQSSLHRYGFNYPSTGHGPSTVKSKHENLFMLLPSEVRRIIYMYAGLFCGFKIHLNYEPPEEGVFDENFCTQYASRTDLESIPQQEDIQPWSEQLSHFIEGPIRHPKILLDRDIWPPPGWSRKYWEIHDKHASFAKCPALPMQLLYVSNEIRRDVQILFWRENTFSIAKSDIGGLRMFDTLPKIALENITTLSIRLNYWRDKTDWQDGMRYHEDMAHFRDEQAPCHATCPRYGFEPLLSVPRTKAEKSVMSDWRYMCRILALYQRPNQLRLWVFCDVADVAAADFWLQPLSDLPLLADCSIRLRYGAENADLRGVARDKVQSLTTRTLHTLQHGVGFHDLPTEIQTQILEYTYLVARHPLFYSIRSKYTPSNTLHLHHSPFSDTHSYENRRHCCETCNVNDETCYCFHRHNSYSTRCTCWVFPKELFLVSKAVRSLATVVFFSKNEFIINPDSNYSCLKNPHSTLWHFLQEIPSDALQHLRHLTWRGSTNENNLVFCKFMVLIDFIVSQMTISKLTLVIDFGHRDKSYHIIQAEVDTRIDFPEGEAKVEWPSALKMAKHMANYQGWKNVFFHLAFQGDYMYPGNRKRMEMILEQIVNGRGYDVISHGKVYRRCSCVDWYDDADSRKNYAYWDERVNYDPTEMIKGKILGESSPWM